MKKIIFCSSLVFSLLSGCAVYPVQPGYNTGYVAPAYVAPYPGYIWLFNPGFGWGWHHPQYGWYRGHR